MAAEMDRLTLATAQGFAIAWSKDSLAAWERSRSARNGETPESKVEGFHQMLGFLSRNFPGSVRDTTREN